MTKMKLRFHSAYRRMALIVLIIFIGLPGNAFSDSQVTLQWDANNPVPAGYRLYGRQAGYAYNFDEPWWEGDQTFTRCTIDQLDENTTYFFVVRAYDADDNESGNSNEVRFSANNNGPDGSAGLINDSSGTGGGSGGGCFLGTLMGP